MVYTKRLSSPGYYKVGRKVHKLVVTGVPGPHSKSRSIPLAIALRDILRIADDISEVREIANKKLVKVDSDIQTNHRFPLGFMDLLSISDATYRILVDKKGLCIKPAEESQSKIKLLKVMRKVYTKGYRLQLGFHDGRTAFVDKDIYKTGDVVVFDTESKEIIDLIQFKRGAVVMISDGKNKGKTGRIEDFLIVRGSQPNKVTIKVGNELIETLKDYVFVVGQESPRIRIE